MKQLIEGIASTRIIDDIRNMKHAEDPWPDEYYDFCTVDSPFYPELSAWLDECDEEWGTCSALTGGRQRQSQRG